MDKDYEGPGTLQQGEIVVAVQVILTKEASGDRTQWRGTVTPPTSRFLNGGSYVLQLPDGHKSEVILRPTFHGSAAGMLAEYQLLGAGECPF